MKHRPLKRSSEYISRVRHYATNLADRYSYEIADVFLKCIETAEKRIDEKNEIGTSAPYILLGQKIILKEFYFKSGPSPYCLIYEVQDDYVGLISLWHGVGARSDDALSRIWARKH